MKTSISNFLAVAVNGKNAPDMEKQITILIVDNNNLMRKTLKVLISEMENALLVGEAANGEEAVALTAQLMPGIILMDINMSPVNGFEAARKILSQNPDARIIGLSLHTEPSYIRNMLKVGARGYITKSSPHEEIIKAINTVAAGGKYISKDIDSILGTGSNIR